MASLQRIRRSGRLSLFLATLIASTAFAAVAFAGDVVTADGDVVDTTQADPVALTLSPGEEVTKSVSFTLTCKTQQHVDTGETVPLTFSATKSVKPAGGALSGNNGAVGPRSAAWPNDRTDCPDPAPTVSSTETQRASVTITAPSAPGTYTYEAAWDIGATGSTVPGSQPDINGSKVTATYTVTVPADTTAPVITPHVSGTLGDNGWYTSDVTVTWDVVDNESTISSKTGCDSTTITSDTTGTTLTCSATSAGGTASKSVTIKRDATAPSVQCEPVPTGWQASNVTINCTASDATSDLADATNDASFSLSTSVADGSADAAAPFSTNSVADKAGNTRMAGAGLTAMVDREKPTITDAGVQAGTLGTNGWYISAVTNRFTADDGAGSGLSTTCAAAFPKNVSTGTDEGSNVSVSSGPCSDAVGNTNDGISSASFKIDLTNPSVAITSPANGATTIAASVNVSGTASDTPSGIASVTVNGAAATYAAGSWSRSGVTLACGANTITATATDVASRTSTDSVTVTRLCFGLQYLQPIDQSTTTPIVNTGKYGRVIPVKVILSLRGGAALDSAGLAAQGLTLQMGVNSATCTTGAAADDVEAYADAGASAGGTNLFRWDATAAQWIYNLDTKAPAGVAMTINSCYLLDVYVSDGTNKVKVSGAPNPFALFKPIK